jgi:hypothetical protein
MGRREGDERPGRSRARARRAEAERGGSVPTEVSGVVGSESDLVDEGVEGGKGESAEGEHANGLREGVGEGEGDWETTRDQRSFQMSSDSRGPGFR